MNQHHKIIQERILQNFVNPELCRQLKLLGLFGDQENGFFWQVEGTVGYLHSYIFDVDGIYEQQAANLSFLNNKERITAYQVVDMEKLLPDYTVSKDGGNFYMISAFITDPIKSDRLPDVFAMMVLKALKQGKILVEEANKQFTKTT